MENRKEYLFDVKLFASIRVRATNEAEARRLLEETIDCADGNFGKWPDGSPVLGEVSVDGEAELIEVNGEMIE